LQTATTATRYSLQGASLVLIEMTYAKILTEKRRDFIEGGPLVSEKSFPRRKVMHLLRRFGRVVTCPNQ
jgi:hypothetical protein